MLVLSLGWTPPVVRAQAQITIVSPFAAGGTSDVISRAVARGIEPILKPAQKEKLVGLRARMATMGGGRRQGGMTSGVVYVLRDGKPVAVPVRVGATDGSFTQIVGPLKVGDEVIVGGGPKPKAAAQGGPMGGGVRVRM